MTTFNSPEDILKALDENPQWRAAVRDRILGEELLQLPARFEAFRQDMTAFAKSTDERLGRLEEGQQEIRSDVAILKEGQQEIRSDVAILKEGQQEIRADVAILKEGQQEIRSDMSIVKGHHARNAAVTESRRICRTLDCRQTRLMDGDWSENLVDHGDTTNIPTGDLTSFQNADLIIQATNRENGRTVYVPVEASFTARSHDFDRASRNARLIEHFKNEPAIPVVASRYLSTEVRTDILQAIEEGRIHWFQIDQKYLEPT